MKRFILLVLIYCLILSGCGEDPILPAQAKTYVDAWAPSVADELAQKSEGAPIRKEMEAVMKAAGAADTRDPAGKEPPFDALVEATYAGRDYKPGFVVHGELSPAGQSVWKALSELEHHVFDPRDYPIARMSDLIQKLEEQKAGHEGGDLNPAPSDLEAVAAFVATQKPSEFKLDESNHPVLMEKLLASPGGERLTTVMVDYETLGKKLAKTSAELEHLLARSLARYSWEMRHLGVQRMFIHKRYDDYYNDPEVRKHRPADALGARMAGLTWRHAAQFADKHYDANSVQITHDNISKTLKDVLASDNPLELVTGLEPQHPQYRKLIKEYVRYTKLVDAGGWEKVPVRKKMKVGTKAPQVEALKKRLKAEGYYSASAPIDQTFDEHLKKAITAYQETHQMKVTGATHHTFWKSVNIPAERRRDQIRINVQRWRDTNIRYEKDETYAFINVADFHVEIWDKKERALRVKVVVGNNNKVLNDETDEMEHANRTPVPIAAYIDRAIYNPFWNVTPRVRTNEILPEVKKSLEDKYNKILERERKSRALPSVGLPPTGSTPPSLLPTTGLPRVAPLTTPPVATPPPALTPPVVATTPPTTPASVDEPVDPKAAAIAASSDPLARFPYYNFETKEIDVSTTDPENIPAWYAANNYEVMYPAKSWEYVRMTPGPHNALGMVKIIFPNLHDVYLHDTNAKALFGLDIRAFSHGCMRVHKPLELAEWLLRRDGLYEPNNVPQLLKTGDYMPIFLKRQVPVFVEYYTVRVDDEGRANFLADIYDYDDNVHLPDPAVRAAAP